MSTAAGFGQRLAWLLACVALGAAIAFAGVFLSGSQWWYLAIPAVMALGWLLLADPTQCEPAAGAGRDKTDPQQRT